MSDLNIEEQEFKDKEMEVVEPVIAGIDFSQSLETLSNLSIKSKYKCSTCADTGECENYYHDQDGELLSKTVICNCQNVEPDDFSGSINEDR